MTADIEELIENFALFSDWEERYRYLIDLGRTLPKLPEDKRTDESLVRGCTSKVWLHMQVNEKNMLELQADSDAHIVRGLIALLFSAYQGKTAQQASQIDIEESFARIGLDQHLSPNRRNGFFAMVEKIKAYSSLASTESVESASAS